MQISRRTMLGALATAPLAGTALAQRRNSRPPNIIVILADDLGYGDLGAYGNKVNRTPHIDRLAARGLRFTDFHSNAPMCTPTRAALLTGRYQNRLGKAFETPLDESYPAGLPLTATTIAKVLKETGYSTAMYGKWHLGNRPPYMPTRHGFDTFRGLNTGDGDHHSHLDRSGQRDWWHDEKLAHEDGYTADLLTQHSVEFIKQNKDRPFFLYLAHLAIHFPWQGPLDRAHRVEGKSYQDLTKLGVHESKDMSAKVREMIEAVDASVGRVVGALDQHGLSRDTLVFITSDNGGYLTYQGGYHNISSNGALRGQKTDMYEGGHRVPAIAYWPGRIAPGVSSQTAITFDLFPTFAQLAGANARAASLGLDGADLSQLLFNRRPLSARTLFWRMRDRKAVRQGDWKLVVAGREAPELYNLRQDLSERNNLAQSEPERTGKLLSELRQWEADVDGAASARPK